MGTDYTDLEILAEVADDDYLIRISKADLHSLVTFSEDLTIRHWDGGKPVVLEHYGEAAVKTKGDSSESNNLAGLPRVGEARLAGLLAGL